MVSSATCHRPGGDPSRAGVRLGALCKQLRRAAAPHLAQQRSAGASQSDAAAAPSLRGFSADSQPARAQIAAHYRRWGFAVVRGLLPVAEAAAVAAASQRLIERAPSERGGALDAQGRPCPDSAAYSFTDPVKADDARTYLHAGQQFVLNRINSPLPMAEPLRVMCAPPPPSSSSHRAAHTPCQCPLSARVRASRYGSPRLLGTVQAIYGSDFVPFAESLVLKQPDSGAGFRFHQVTPHTPQQ